MAAHATSARTDNTALIDAARRRVESDLPGSMACFQAAQEVVPGASGRSRFFWPIPIYIDHADGAYIYDVDGRRYVDTMLGLGPMILGHRHPVVLDALRQQLERGWHFGPPVPDEAALGRIIVQNVPGAERVVFVGSGTEASLAALHIARAATGRDKLAKFEGGYHGWHDFGTGSLRRTAGPPESAVTLVDELGRAAGAAGDIVVLPFNHRAAFDRIRREAGDLACVFIEGLQASAGAVVAEPAFAQELRAVCDECGVLLIMDEVITGFRLGASGAAGYLGVTPDLSTLGKVIGGGFPIGAVCGRAELLNLIMPNARGESVVMAGTFSANPMTMVAGRAQLGVLTDDKELYVTLNRLGDRLRAGIAGVLADVGVPGHITGAGSVYGVHLFTSQMPRSARDRADTSKITGRVPDGYLLRRGVLQAPMHGFLSTVHTEHDVDTIIAAYAGAFAEMKNEGFFDGQP